MSEGTSYKNKTWFIAVKIAENLFAKNNTDKLIAQATIHYPIIKRRNNVLRLLSLNTGQQSPYLS